MNRHRRSLINMYFRQHTKLKSSSIWSSMEGHKIKTKSKFKVRHQKHKLFRANDPLLSVLMWGVNFTVSYYLYLV